MPGSGVASLDFGAFPGASDASLVITGQTGIASGSLVEAWLLPADTADHLADEHLLEALDIRAGKIVAGTGFTIYGINEFPLGEPSPIMPTGYKQSSATSATLTYRQPGAILDPGGRSPLIYGVWNVAWAWA